MISFASQEINQGTANANRTGQPSITDAHVGEEQQMTTNEAPTDFLGYELPDQDYFN